MHTSVCWHALIIQTNRILVIYGLKVWIQLYEIHGIYGSGIPVVNNPQPMCPGYLKHQPSLLKHIFAIGFGGLDGDTSLLKEPLGLANCLYSWFPSLTFTNGHV